MKGLLTIFGVALFATPAISDVKDFHTWDAADPSSIWLQDGIDSISEFCFDNAISSAPNFPSVQYEYTLLDEEYGIELNVFFSFGDGIKADYVELTVGPGFYTEIPSYMAEDNITTCVKIFEHQVG